MGWRGMLEHTRRITGLLNKIQLFVCRRLRKGYCISLWLMSKQIHRLYKKAGPLFLARYLKACLGCLMWYVAGRQGPRPKLAVPVSLTKTGLPRIIPSGLRREIRERNYRVIRLIVSVFSIYRLIKVPARKAASRYGENVYHKGWNPSEATLEVSRSLATHFWAVLRRRAPRIEDLNLRSSLFWFQSYTSGPMTNLAELHAKLKSLGQGRSSGLKERRRSSGCCKQRVAPLFTYPLDLQAFFGWSPLHDLSQALSQFSGPRLAAGPAGGLVVNYSGFLSKHLVHSGLLFDGNQLCPDARNLIRGRFGVKIEAAGKVRLFAIASPIVQRFLRPLHDWLMKALSLLEPNDGTYNQLLPLTCLKGFKNLYSFDLKAATDLLPAVLTRGVLESLFGPELASAWHSVVSGIGFRLPKKGSSVPRRKLLKFNRGQPLGLYSSWPAFTLTHHALVWWAAVIALGEAAWVGFKDYAILGDDIVIANTQVARAYMDLVSSVDGVISREKSLTSKHGTFEFAKRFFVDSHLNHENADCSPVSAACLLLAPTACGFSALASIQTDYGLSFRLRGAGYRTLARVRSWYNRATFEKLSKRWRRHSLCYFGPGGPKPLPLRVWFSWPDYPAITPFEEGRILHLLIEKAKPKSIDDQSVDDLWSLWRSMWLSLEEDEEDEFGTQLEVLLLSFLQDHLSYLKWYTDLLLLPYSELTFEHFLRTPVRSRSLYVPSVSKKFECRTYGLLFRIWDWLRCHEPILALTPLQSHHECVEIRFLRWKSASLCESLAMPDRTLSKR